MNIWLGGEVGDTTIFPILIFFPVPSLPVASEIKYVLS